MTMLLTLAGYSAYQAACLAPWLWFLLIGAALCIAADIPEKGGSFD